MSGCKKSNKNREKNTKNIKKETEIAIKNVCWICFGVLFSLLTPLCSMFYTYLSGYTVSYVDYVPDLVLIIVGTGCNFINLCIDMKNNLSYNDKIIYPVVSGVIVFIAWGFYCYIKKLPNPKFKTSIIFALCILFIFTWSMLGVRINCKHKKK